MTKPTKTSERRLRSQMGWWGENVPEESLSRDEAERILKRLWRMLGGYRGKLALATVVLASQAAALLAGPLLVKHGIDAGLLSNGGKGDATALNQSVVVYLILAIAGFFLGKAAIILVARIG